VTPLGIVMGFLPIRDIFLSLCLKAQGLSGLSLKP
jgi:hypothetical protein